MSGPIPNDLGNLKNLLSLDLYSNNFSGSIPDTLGKLTKLRFLRLHNNSLTGSIPVSLTSVTALKVLDVSNNYLSGYVPDNGSFSLLSLISYANNLDLCGSGTGKPCPGSSIRGNGVSDTGVIVGVVAGAVILFAVVVWWLWLKPREHFFDVLDIPEEDLDIYRPQFKRFTLQELQDATDNFGNNNFLGRGGFGEVYKGRLADGSLVAVKRQKKEYTPGGKLQFEIEVKMISMAVHRNLLRLLGFCMTPTEGLLVYPYMANGSVASCLRERPANEPPLDWPTRKRIALGSARGLSYLHDHCDPKIIHRDVKAANILLDEEFETFVGDFGLAKLMGYEDTHVTTAVRGTFGHIAPEYLSTGKSSEKTDVSGYGIMLLDLITGQRTFDLARLARDNDVTLLDLVKGLLKEKMLEMLVDPDLHTDYIESEAEQLFQVALLCTQDSPMDRPKMSDVVRMLEDDGFIERWEERKKVEVVHQEVEPGEFIPPPPFAPPFSPPPFAPPPVSNPVNSVFGAIAGGLAAGAALLFAVPAIGFEWYRRWKPQEHFFDVPAEEDPEVHLGQRNRFSLQELQAATDNFGNKNILGRGGFGKVYKGRLADGSLVAVKRLKEERTPGGEVQFQTEVGMISTAVHRNLLSLRGYCMTPTERLLVYPYMANGSVASCLRERPANEPPLDWPTRKRIALGSARGLSYLHDHSGQKIIHRDVKASNILLDEEFEAVVGDFGLAKLMDYNDTHVTTAVRGTIGHIAPEYLSTGKCTQKTDVFGYGIVLLELITGQRAFDLVRLANDDDVMLLDWVKGLLKEKKFEMLVDQDLQTNYIESEVEQLIQVALLCTQNSPTDRPKMSDVVRMLEDDSLLAEKWEEWQEVEVVRPEIELARYSEWIVDSTENLRAMELSGPR